MIRATSYACPYGKHGYATKALAKRAMKQAKRHGCPRLQHVYRCTKCGMWHATKMPRPPLVVA